MRILAPAFIRNAEVLGSGEAAPGFAEILDFQNPLMFFYLPSAGLEPARLSALVPKTSMSTNSITKA